MMSCYRLVTYTESVMTSNSKNNLGDPKPSIDDCLFCFTSSYFEFPIGI